MLLFGARGYVAGVCQIYSVHTHFKCLFVCLTDMPSLSGVSDMDYPLQGPGLISVPNLPELSAVRRVPLPPELVEQFSRILYEQMYRELFLGVCYMVRRMSHTRQNANVMLCSC